jgi:Ca2+-binding EF-hand superfamily protein
LSKEEAKEALLEAYDINNDGNIKWAEFHISNQFLKKQPKTLRAEFKYFDKDQNWVITTKEL